MPGMGEEKNFAESGDDSVVNEKSGKIDEFIDLLVLAFDELHSKVLQKITAPGQYLSNHGDYPRQSMLDSGFPIFHETGFFEKTARKDYVGSIRPMGLLGMLAIGLNRIQLPALDKLVEFVDNEKSLSNFKQEKSSAFYLEQIISQAVESYFHLFGLGPIEAKNRTKILAPIVHGSLIKSFELRVVVPIALTHFDFDHHRINDTSYIARIPRGTQLSRARMNVSGTGAVKAVVGAATHAFVSTGWMLNFDTNYGARQSLNNPSKNVLDEIDLFFAALRAVTGATTGYAQVLMLPRKVTFELYCDLPPTFGATYRRYPSIFDNYAWAYSGQSVVSKDQIKNVTRFYKLSLTRREQRIQIAMKRLNSCMTRDDAVDAILDAMIGIEVLLGDKENQALSYKLRMRAGALAGLRGDRPPSEVLDEVNRIYAIRSKIVHGLSSQGGNKGSKNVSAPAEERYQTERYAAAAMLRYVLDVLMENPRYLDPAILDRELLLGTVHRPIASAEEPDLFS